MLMPFELDFQCRKGRLDRKTPNNFAHERHAGSALRYGVQMESTRGTVGRIFSKKIVEQRPRKVFGCHAFERTRRENALLMTGSSATYGTGRPRHLKSDPSMSKDNALPCAENRMEAWLGSKRRPSGEYRSIGLGDPASFDPEGQKGR